MLSDENAFLRKFYIVDTKRTNTAVRLLASLAADAAWLLAQPSLQAPLFSLRRRALGAAIKHGLVERGNAKWLRVTKLRQWATEAYKPSPVDQKADLCGRLVHDMFSTLAFENDSPNWARHDRSDRHHGEI